MVQRSIITLALLHEFVYEFRGNNTYIILDRTVLCVKLTLAKFPIKFSPFPALNSLIKEHACLSFLEKNSTILSIFHLINEKIFHHTLIFHVINFKKIFSPYSFILVCSLIREFKILSLSSFQFPSIEQDKNSIMYTI